MVGGIESPPNEGSPIQIHVLIVSRKEVPTSPANSEICGFCGSGVLWAKISPKQPLHAASVRG